MARKGRSAGGKSKRRPKSDDAANDGSASVTGVDALSESHTVASLLSEWDASVNGDDDSLTGDGHDDLLFLEQNADDAAAAERLQSRLNRLVEALEPMDEFTTEKRSARREVVLKKAFHAISQWATGTAGQSMLYARHLDAILGACKFSLRQGAPSEQYASCRVLEVTAVVLGANHHSDYYDVIYNLLHRVLHSKQRATAVRMAAFRTMAVSCFINAEDDVATEHVMDLAEEFAKPVHRSETLSKSLRATALQVWTLLATTVDDNYIAGRDDVSIGRGLVLLPLLQLCLDDTSPLTATGSSTRLSLQAAAGQCLVVIHESRLNLGLLEDNRVVPSSVADADNSDSNSNNHYTESSLNQLHLRSQPQSQPVDVNNDSAQEQQQQQRNTTDLKYQQGSWEGTEWETIVDEMTARISELAVESSHHISKKAKKEIRAIFRDFQLTLVDNEPPTPEVVQFHSGSTLQLDSWHEIVQLQFIRHSLQGNGYQIQLLTNPTLQQIFGFTPSAIGGHQGLSQIEKRLYYSKTSEQAKLADQERHKKRRQRMNVKNHFLTVDGEGI